jgi:hypothetical protein
MDDGLYATYEGFVIRREDTEGDPDHPLGRVKVRIPGLIEESAWAYPGGWGRTRNGPVPQLDELVEVYFIAGDRDQPRWRPARPPADAMFPEFTHPDVTVIGDEHLRIVRDPRAGKDYTCIRALEQVNGADDVLVEIFISHTGRALRIYAGAGVKIESEGQLTIESAGDVDVQGRKVLPRNKPIQ